MCPKISDLHINVMKNNFAKMRVSLVLQVGMLKIIVLLRFFYNIYLIHFFLYKQLFSSSVFRALRFYKPYEKTLEDSESTADFCELMNNTFDALNRITAETGLRIGCTDLQVWVFNITY